MFKISSVNADSLAEAETILKRIYDEQPAHWPHGLNARCFDGGLYLVREKQSSVPVGFVGFQVRYERAPGQKSGSLFSGLAGRSERVGYYSIGILPRFRRHGYAKEAVSKLLAAKSATVDRMRALVVAGNQPSMALASVLRVPVTVK